MRIRSALVLLVMAAALGCDSRSDTEATTRADSAATAQDSVAPQPRAFADRVAVFMLADSTELDMMRQEYGADFGTVADDMMWYRSEAWDWLERRGIPIVNIEGRPPVTFRVAGVERPYDYAGETGGDVLILYDTDLEPVTVAPVDVAERATAYFTDLPQPLQQ